MVESDGAQVVDLEDYNMPPSLILRSDGGTLYTTRDIAAAMYRMREYHFYKALYVTGVTQALHFKQWFKVVELMGYDWAKGLHHIPFGTVSLQGSKLSTRKGQVLLLTDVLDEAVAKTLEIINEKNPNLPNKEQVAEQMGVGAIVFSDLSSSRIKDVTFSWEEILNFDGETGPYVQYTHARACSVLRKSALDFKSLTFEANSITTETEFELVKCLYAFPEHLTLAGADFEPSILTRYLVNLAQAFNRFYNRCPILVEDDSLKQSRLLLVKAVQQTLKKGLWLIGVAAPERV
jgi:arginyl-tRNA synthetase